MRKRLAQPRLLGGLCHHVVVRMDDEHGTGPGARARHLVERRGEVIPRDHRRFRQRTDGRQVEPLPELLTRRAAQQQDHDEPQERAHHARRDARRDGRGPPLARGALRIGETGVREHQRADAVREAPREHLDEEARERRAEERRRSHAAALEQRVEARERRRRVGRVGQIHGEDAGLRGQAVEDDEEDVGAPDGPRQQDDRVGTAALLEPPPRESPERAAVVRHGAPETVIGVFEAGRGRHGARTLPAAWRSAQRSGAENSRFRRPCEADTALTRLACRVHGTRPMNGVLHDLRFTVRNMARNPGLAVVIAISLALGIGANTAIFSLIRTVLMTSLPVKDADRLVLLHWHGETWPSGLNQSGAGGPNNPAYKNGSRSLAYPFFRQLSADTSTFESVFAFAPLGSERQNTTLAAEDGGERVDGEMVSGDYFRGLGASATVGRLITRDDEARAAQVAVLSYPYWTRRFGGDPSIVGRAVTINHLPFTIVGVTSQRFFGVQPGRVPDVWVAMIDSADLAPWGYHPSDGGSLLDIRSYWWTHVMARLKDGVDERAAQVKADAIFQSFVADALPQADPKLPPHIGFEPGAIGIDTLRASYG